MRRQTPPWGHPFVLPVEPAHAVMLLRDGLPVLAEPHWKGVVEARLHTLGQLQPTVHRWRRNASRGGIVQMDARQARSADRGAGRGFGVDYESLYRKLDVLDTKCSALLQLSSLVLALNIIPVAVAETTGIELVLTAVVVALFLVSSLLALSVLWVNWTPTEATVVLRTRTYLAALAATALGVVAMAARVVQGLV